MREFIEAGVSAIHMSMSMPAPIALLVFAVACQSGSGGAIPMSMPDGSGQDQEQAQEVGIAPKDAGPIPYPPGPYGVGTGNVVEDATFYGYPRFDDRALTQISLHDFFNPDGSKTASAGVPLTAILLTVGAVWCSPCVQEARILPAVAEKFLPAGIQIVQDLFQGPNQSSGAAATQGDLDQWMTTHMLPFPVFIDPAKKLAPYFDVSTLPFVMLLDAKTMTTVGATTGFAGQTWLEDFICEFAPQRPSICP